MECGITLLISRRIALYTAAPVLGALAAEGVRVFVVCPRSVMPDVCRICPTGSVTVIEMESLDRQPVVARLHRLAVLMLTSLNLSFHYNFALRKRLGETGLRMLSLARKFLPHTPHHEVNRRTESLMSRFVKNPFPTNTILAVSRVRHPHLLCAPEQNVFTLMESWDHPTKQPAGYTSDGVFVWNEDVAADWKTFQGDTNVMIGYPFKLRYALGRRTLAGAPRTPGNVALYAASSSSMSDQRRFDEEMEVIEEVCRATRKAGWDLIVKPRPNGRRGDFDVFGDRHAHVAIAEYGESEDPSDYYLDDEYNARRIRQLEAVDLVICLTTTFALDAAALEVPVLQLDLREYSALEHTARRSTNHHLVRYLLNDERLTLAPSEGRTLTEEIVEFLLSPDDRAEKFTAKLRRWLANDGTMNDAVERITATLSAAADVITPVPAERPQDRTLSGGELGKERERNSEV